MTNLINLDDYKAYKNIESDADDTILSRIVSSVNSYVVNYCSRTILNYHTNNKVEYFDGNTDSVYLDETPITSIVSVKISSDGGVTKTDLVENTDFFVDNENGLIISKYGKFISSDTKFKSLEVTYTGGYAKTPEDLKIACLDLVEYYRKEQYIPSRTMGNSSMVHISSDDSKKIPNYISRILDMYRLM